MSLELEITARRTTITAQERIDLNIVGGPEDTIVDVDVYEVFPGSSGHLTAFKHAYIRGSTNKRQLVAACRVKAQTESDALKFTGGESSLVGVRFPL